MAKEKQYLEFPDETKVEAELGRGGLLAVHKPLDSRSNGYVITYIPDFSVVIKTRLKGEATQLMRALEFLMQTLSSAEMERQIVERLRLALD
jgi:hypothetical protein